MSRQVHAEGLRERRNMSRTTPEPNFDVWAVGHDGEDLFITESAHDREVAEMAAEDSNEYINEQEEPTSGAGDDLSHVSHYEVRRR